MEKWQGKVAVVTGATHGIGAAIVIELVKHGMIVCGLGRRKDKIEVNIKHFFFVNNCDLNRVTFECDLII